MFPLVLECVDGAKPGSCANCSPVKVLECCCLTSESKCSDVDNVSLQHINFGKCFYGCTGLDGPGLNTYHEVKLGEQFDEGVYAQFYRKGVLCGQCNNGYGPVAYSFSLKCVECGDSTHWTRVPIYVLVAYGPMMAVIVYC